MHEPNADPSTDRNQDDTADDNDLAKAIVDTVNTVKAWAKRASDKLSDSFSSNLLKGKATKEAMIPLIGEKGYKDKAKEIRGKRYIICSFPGLKLGPHEPRIRPMA